ncbi:diguanylate cyclase (GGDEF) domain-containing protein [Dethiosulfatibacter aminovorans DSM 17477]|uniref:Diguanylate cyclase (GGDEF) domain-containing protein n=1 Tax=Dethiosulfatibacter aminovorans DSM 17477 TaxID=1121476 RepID=A0A1M6L1U0_9FIRM|nr:GGDEF domain-containing protein [Dethiosulfatibacter aminovorans]SHJ65200.1 diguanylate cyclase (GGDEF) domain-containing protein [Dethiosulfatibacter aminovorans DSM 17477]
MSYELKEEEKLRELIDKLQRELDKKNEELFVQEREIAQLKEMLKQESYTDKLTGFYSPKAFESILQHKKSRAERTRKPFSLLLIDINDFKEINEKYGHTAGDEVLKNFAKSVKSILRAEDSIARWGDDEFIVLLSETNFDDARIVEAKIEFFMKDWEVHLMEHIIHYSYCIGISQYRFNESVIDVVERAKDNLKADKHRFDQRKSI